MIAWLDHKAAIYKSDTCLFAGVVCEPRPSYPCATYQSNDTDVTLNLPTATYLCDNGTEFIVACSVDGLWSGPNSCADAGS